MTATRTLILAGSFSEAAKYARGKQLRSYRYAVNAAAVGSYQATDIVELPGYADRRDKFAFQSAIRNLLRRGVEVRKDSYTPPPPPEPPFRETLTRSDWLFGSVPEPDVLREVGATDDEVKHFTDIAETAARLDEVLTPNTDAMSNLIAGVSDALQQKQDDFVESAPSPRRGRPPGSKNKPRVNAPKDSAGKENKAIQADVDDLFED